MPRGEPTMLRERLAGEGGQTFVFVLTILLALLLLVATSINIGQAVNRRILLQMLADAGAFTGATEMARGMNTIAEQNGRIQLAWAQLASTTRYFTRPACEPSDAGTRAYGIARLNLGRVVNAVNAGYGRRVVDEARRVTEYNAIDLFPDEQLSMSESLPWIQPQRPANHVVDLEQVPSGTAPEAFGAYPGYNHRAWACRGFLGDLPRDESFDLWYRAVPDAMPIAFVWVVTAPPVRARWFDRFFGPYAVPEMSAAAVAKPIGGEIQNARARYVAKMVPLRDLLQRIGDGLRQRWRNIYH